MSAKIRKHRVTHPVIGPATWHEIQVARDRLGKVCSWCFEPVSAGRRTRCGKAICEEMIWQAYAWSRCRRMAIKASKMCRCGKLATEVEHILPVSLGGLGDQSNLRALCTACHREATNRLRRDKDRYVA